jgi:hypothetical protein
MTMQNWHLLYNTTTGQSVSIGTVIADPLPKGITALPLSDAEGEGLQNGSLIWDAATRTLIPTPPPTVTAEEWIDIQGYTAIRLISLLDAETKLKVSNKESAKLNAVRQWLDSILGSYAIDPTPKNNWPNAPYVYEETIQDAIATLTANPET